MGDERGIARFILTAEQIGAALDRTEVEVEVPEWTTAEMQAAGQVACVKLQPISVEQRDKLFRLCSEDGVIGGKLDNHKFLRLLVVYAMTQPQVTEEQLAQRAWGVIDRLATQVMDISGMGKHAAVSASVTFRPES